MANKNLLVLFLCILSTYANPLFDLEIPGIDGLDQDLAEIGGLDLDLEPPELDELNHDLQAIFKNIDYSKLQAFVENFNYSDFEYDLDNVAERKKHPELGLNTVQLIERHGYPSETHIVTTEDGYILTMHRIPHGKDNFREENKPVVLVMAGILCSSADWVTSGPERALAYQLADAGYDVWLGNNRGTTESRQHTSLNPNKRKYWNFSFHEMGIYDLPAKIDYILDVTQQSSLHYIAHSQGSTSFFVMASERPEYNSKIRLMTALAPVTYAGNVKNPFVKLILPFLDLAILGAKLLRINHVLIHRPIMTAGGQIFCSDSAPTQDLCPLILFLATGFDEPQLNKTNLPVLFSNFPAGSSVKQMWHFAQNMKSDKFRKYDYGLVKNLQEYGQRTPPKYDLSKVTAPVATFSSLNDWIASEKDVAILVSELPNVALDYLIPYEKFNHLDYMWAIDANRMVYDIIIEAMQKY